MHAKLNPRFSSKTRRRPRTTVGGLMAHQRRNPPSRKSAVNSGGGWQKHADSPDKLSCNKHLYSLHWLFPAPLANADQITDSGAPRRTLPSFKAVADDGHL